MEYQRYGLFVGGEWRQPLENGRYEIMNPATEELIGLAPQAAAKDVAAAVDAAVPGMAAWRALSTWQRSDVLRRIAGLLRERVQPIATQIALETGKPLPQAKGEVMGSAEQFEWFADEARRIFGRVIDSRLAASRHYVQFQPVGIAAAFTPWNFPVALAARKIAPALAAGCAVICRGAEEAPGAAMLLVECCKDAGVPAGAISLLNGRPAPITDAIMADDRVRKISFTGSVRVGKILAAAAAATLKRVTMELGGHSPVIVMNDADVTEAARLSAAAKFRNCGQICISPTRFFVFEDSMKHFISEFCDAAKAIRIGNGLDDNIDMGPLATRTRLETVDGLVQDAIGKGAQLVMGGCRAPGFKKGHFYAPTVLANVPGHARAMTEEPFGPLALVNPVKSLDEALKAANDVEFGLSAYAFTRSLKNADAIAQGLEAGMVSINSFAPVMAEVPFGGVKSSGYGREGGELGTRDFLETKSITVKFE
ncbi:NAD-dependent succinate-semialdehyde dehydrogenase [Xanthobacteraceae bacterium Astr-EGSB]|uniref:NAD-dependent succinate-semialdehyde dehydrogenase n=1 Tax=Astrobacterium formosum TaxID=3069710 RepID=UPI0027B5F422|nr:NAD-dependent succinate-semialdehyde dehydrogenase [Xanthobacteraceae bacterium Astr-EGSB]